MADLRRWLTALIAAKTGRIFSLALVRLRTIREPIFSSCGHGRRRRMAQAEENDSRINFSHSPSAVQ